MNAKRLPCRGSIIKRVYMYYNFLFRYHITTDVTVPKFMVIL